MCKGDVATMNQDIMDLVRRHCATLRQEFSEADTRFAALNGGSDPARVEALTAQAHKIKGSSGTLGFSTISRHAERYEHTLRAMNARCLSGDDMAALRRMHTELGRTIAEIAPEQSTLYQRMRGGPGA